MSKKEVRWVVVALAVYNGEQWLVEQIESILSQEGVETHVFVNIDESNDKSLSICRKYEALYPERFILLPGKGRLGNAALNFFHIINEIKDIEFEYFAMSDQDDIWLSNKLITAIRKMEASACGGYSSNLTPFDTLTNEEWLIDKSQPIKEYDYLFQGASAGCTYVLNKRAFDIVQVRLRNIDLTLQERPSHDWTIYAICRSHSVPWFVDGDSFIRYRQHSGNFYGSSRGVSDYYKKYLKIKSGWYFKQILFLEGVLSSSSGEREIFNCIKSPSLINKIKLLRNVKQYRRRTVDVAFLFFIVFLFLRKE